MLSIRTALSSSVRSRPSRIDGSLRTTIWLTLLPNQNARYSNDHPGTATLLTERLRQLTIQPAWRHRRLRILAACTSHQRPRQCAGTSAQAAHPYCTPGPLPHVSGCCKPINTTWRWGQEQWFLALTGRGDNSGCSSNIRQWEKHEWKTTHANTTWPTVLDLVNLSSHLMASSGETLLFDRSM